MKCNEARKMVAVAEVCVRSEHDAQEGDLNRGHVHTLPVEDFAHRIFNSINSINIIIISPSLENEIKTLPKLSGLISSRVSKAENRQISVTVCM